MTHHEPITVTRDCEAIQIPSGQNFTIPVGTDVRITQDLGGTYTVAGHFGLARIMGKDGDALGFDVAVSNNGVGGISATFTVEDVWDRLRTCYDPEIPVNIVDLGLVYSCNIVEADGAKRVEVQMTLTAPGCGMGPAIAAEAESKILTIEGVSAADVQLVWDPPWNQSMISEAGKMHLGLI